MMARSLRVGFDVGKAVGPADGVGRFGRSLLRALVEEAPAAGVELHLYDLIAGRARGDDLVAILGGRLPDGIVVHGRAPRSGQVDLFHATTFRVPPRVFCAIVLTLYDLSFVSHPECHTLANRVLSLVGTAEAAARGAVLAAISGHTRDQAVRLLGMPADRIAVIPLAADPAFRPVDAGAARRRLAERHGIDRPFLLAVGSLEPRKNLARLVDACERLRSCRRRELALVLAGSQGWRNRELLERLEGSEIDIRRAGPVPTADLVDLYAAAEVLVYPSLEEGFGLPVLEAQACRAPVVASAAGAVPEAAGDGAVLVDPLDVGALAASIEDVLCRPDLRADLVRRGAANAARFSWQRCAREHLTLYRQVAEGGREPVGAAHGASMWR